MSRYSLRRHGMLAVLIVVLGVGLPAWAAPPRSLLRVDTRFQGAPGREEHPKAQILILEDEIGFELESDGHTVYTERDAIKLLTPEGAESYSSLARVYRQGSETVEILEARTIRPDGTVLDVLPPQIQDRPLLPDSPLYRAYRVVRLEFPEATPGSVVEFRLRTRRAPRPDGRWWASSYVQNPDPILHSTYTVRVPEGTDLRWLAPGVTPGRPMETLRDGVRTLFWEVRDVPALAPEPAMPPLEQFLQRLEITNFPDWPSVGDWFAPRWRAAVQDAAGLDIVAAGVASTTDPVEKRLRAALSWAAAAHTVQDAIPESWDPHPARSLPEVEVLSPTDMAVLLTAVLQRLGVEAWPVLAAPVQRRDLEKNLPQPETLARLVLAVSRPGGGWWWIDPGSPGELLSSPPAGIQEVGALLVGPEGSRLISTPCSDAEENLRDLQMEVRVEPDGKAELTMSMAADGLAAALWRSLVRELADTPAAEREEMLGRLFQNLAQGFVASGRVYSYYFPEALDPSRPFQLSATVMFNELATPRQDGKALAMPVPLFGGDRLASLAGPGARTFPVKFDYPLRDDLRVHVALPEGSQVLAVPGDSSVETPVGTFFSTSRQQGNQVWLYSRLVLRRAWVSPEDFADLRRLAEAQASLLSAPLIFVPPAPKAAEETP